MPDLDPKLKGQTAEGESPAQEVESQPGEEVDIEGGKEKVIGEAEQVVAEARQFVSDHQGEPGAEEAVAEMGQLQNEVGDLKKTFLQRWKEIFSNPVGYVKKRGREKKESELAIVDNEKIISDLKKELQKIKKVWGELRPPSPLDGKKRRVEDASFSVLVRKLVEISDTFEHANKGDDSKWREIEDDIGKLSSNGIKRIIDIGDFSSAVVLWDRTGDEQSRSETLKTKMVWLAVEEAKKPSIKKGDFVLSEFVEKKKSVDEFDKKVQGLLKHDDLLKFYQTKVRGDLMSEFFSPVEVAFIEQGDEVVAGLKKLDESEQNKVAQFFTYNEELWAGILKSERPGDLTKIILEFIESSGSNPGSLKFDGSELFFLVSLSDHFPVAKRKELWPKIKSKLDKFYGKVKLDVVYTLLSIADLSGVTEEDISKNLDSGSLERLSVILLSFGRDALGKDWNKESVLSSKWNFSLGYGESDEDKNMREWVKSMSPSIKSHLQKQRVTQEFRHSVGNPLYTQYDYLVDFKKLVDSIPETYREIFLMKLDGGFIKNYPKESDVDHFSENKIKNFLEFVNSPEGRGLWTFENFMEVSSFFDQENWFFVSAGIDIYREIPISFDSYDDKVRRFIIWREAGKEDNGVINGAVQKMCKHSPDYLRKKYYYSETTSDLSQEKNRRSSYGIEMIYNLSNLCREKIGNNFDLYWEMIESVGKFSGFDKKILKALLQGDLAELDKDTVDLPIIEGKLLDIYVKLNELLNKDDYSTREGRDLQSKLEFVGRLSEEGKHIFAKLFGMVRFRDDEVDVVKDIIDNGEIDNIEKVVKSWGIEKDKHYIELSVLRKMANNLDCLGLYYYFQPSNFYDERIIDKILELHTSGLPKSFYLDFHQSVDNLFGLDTNDFLQWETASLVDICRQADTLTVPLDLRHIVAMSRFKNNPENIANRLKMVEITKDIYSLVLGSSSETRVDATQEIFNKVKEFLGRDPSEKERKKIFDYDVSPVSVAALDFLLNNPDVFNNYLNSNWNSFPDVIINLDKTILDNPVFWSQLKYLDGKTLGNSEMVKNILDVFVLFQSQGVEITCDYVSMDDGFGFLAGIPQKAPWIMEPGFFKDWLFVGWDTLSYLCNVSKDEAMAMRDVALVVDHDRVSDLFELSLELTKDDVSKLNELKNIIGVRLPIKFLKEHLNNIRGKTPQDLVKYFDDSISKSGKVNSGDADEWTMCRRRGIVAGVADKIPKAMSSYLVRHFGLNQYRDSHYKDENENPYFLAEGLKDLNDEEFANLEKMADFCSERKRIPNTDSLLIIIKSKNFPVLLQIIADGLEDEHAMFYWPKERLQFFADNITGEVLDKYKTLPKYLKVEFVDAPVFFGDESVTQVVNFADKLRGIFGEKFSMSVYDLLVLDWENDLKNLEKIENETFGGLSPEVLAGLLYVGDEELKGTIQKVLSIMNKDSNISSDIALDSLQKLGPELRRVVILNKINSFGWELFEKNLVGGYDLGLDRVDVVQWAKMLFYGQKDKFTVMNYKVLEVLLEGDVDLFRSLEKITEMFDGSPQELWEFLEKNGDGLPINLRERLNIFLPYFVNHEPFWRETVDNCPEKIIDYFESIPTDFAKNSPDLWSQVIDRLIGTNEISRLGSLLDYYFKEKLSLDEDVLDRAVDKYISSGGRLAFLSEDVGENPDNVWQKEKQNIFKKKIELVVDKGWQKDILLAVSYLKNMQNSGLLDIRYLETVHGMIEKIMGQESDVKLDEENREILLATLEKLSVELLINLDPSIKQTLNDPKKLGALRGKVIDKLSEFARGLFVSVGLDQAKEVIIQKLREIKKVYDSSDSSEAAKRLIFLDNYNLESCFDNIGDDRLSEEEVKKKIEEDVEEILLASGNENQIRYCRKNGKENLAIQAEEIIRQADERNRNIYRRLLAGVESPAEILLSDKLGEEAITHGTSHEYLRLMLESGNFSGELLGSSTRKDNSGILGTDVSKVKPSEGVGLGGRLDMLSNINWGDIALVYSFYKQGKNAEDRPAKFSGYLGVDHELIRSGIPSSEITAIVIKETNPAILEKIKKDIATKGLFISVVDKEGKLQFSVEEYEEMKVFYYDLSRRGYPVEVIDSVYNYYKSQDLGGKHRLVIDKAFKAIKNGESSEDLAVLVSFLQTNDLNRGDANWYKEATFKEIMDFIRFRTTQKIRQKAKQNIFGSVRRLSRNIQVRERDIEFERETASIQDNIYVRDFLRYQLPYTLFGKDFENLDEVEKIELQKEMKKYAQAVARLSHGKVVNEGGGRVDTRPNEVLEIASLFSEQKSKLMQRLWVDVWRDIESKGSYPADMLAMYKKIIIPTISGSGGRQEIVLGSDLDYNLFVDDRLLEGENKDAVVLELKRFVNEVLALKMNEILLKNKIHADAGLAKEDRTPFTLLSRLTDFPIDLNKDRQEEEPTEILDTAPLFLEGSGVVEQSKENMLLQNKDARLLPAFVQKDLEVGGKKKSFIQEFEDLFRDVASGKMLERVKQSLQRPIMFKIDYLLFDALGSGIIPSEESRNIPASTTGKIDFLKKYNVLSNVEAGICLEILAFAYKVRFLGELYSDKAKIDGELQKNYNVTFRVEDLSYDERERLIMLLKEFKAEVLYK